MENQINLELMAFVEQQILPRYNAFDKAHNLRHVTRVIDRAVRLARQVGADINMTYVAAAYHDLGLEGPRAIHHKTSGRIILQDARLRRWFSTEQIKIISEAAEDHRASASHAPRSLYGRIVAEADRDLQPEMVFRRTVAFGLDHYPEMGREEHWRRFVAHLDAKYSAAGYIRLWIPGSENERALALIRHTMTDRKALREIFDRLYDEENDTAPGR